MPRAQGLERVALEAGYPSIGSGRCARSPRPCRAGRRLRRPQNTLMLREALEADGLQPLSTGDGSYTWELSWLWLPALLICTGPTRPSPILEDADALPRRPRSLRIELDSTDELHALVSHLLPKA